MIKNITSSINKIIKKIGKINFALLVVVIFSLIIMGLYQTFSMFVGTEDVSYSDNTKSYKFIIGSIENNELTIDAKDSKYIDITIINNRDIDLLYALYYSINIDSDDMIVGYLSESSNKPSGEIKANSKIVVSLKVINNKTTAEKIKFGVNSGAVGGGELNSSGKKITKEITNLDKASVNVPILDNNLIPVYYDTNDNSWHKADEANNNTNYKWYNYGDKEWANAVMVSDSTRTNYLNSKVGTLVNEVDIVAYFVWIPRYKYRLWNASRNGMQSYDYIYDAYSDGIDIKFENGIENSGNVSCNYITGASNDKDVLSDNCLKNGNSITQNDSNLWYTHPAFTYGNKELTGFWVGKFETTGTGDSPTILPDKISIRNQTVSNYFTISKKFNNYGFNNVIDSHMLKNIEWGAVSYLTHSIYGLCDDIICRDVYLNNSTSGYTGRSAGIMASDANGTEYGSYTYDGYTVTDNTKAGEIDFSKVASTTGNVYGVYDMSGGANEYVMGNMVSESNSFNPIKSGTNWNNSKNITNKYYNAYSFGLTSENELSLSRTILGDATGEVTAIIDNGVSAWKSSLTIEGITSKFVNKDNPWFVRGGSITKDAGLFNYSNANGDKNINNGFRIALS